MPQTIIRAPESTENIPAARRVRDVDDRIQYLDPDVAPLTLILQRARSKATVNSKFEWMEKDLPARWDQINNGAGYASGATSVVVDNGAYFSVGDIVNVPRTSEKFKVDAVVVGTNTLTIARGVGSTAAAALVDNDDLQIIGNAYTEGSLSAPEKSHIETFPFNYTQITRTPLGVTGSEMVSENYTGPDRARLRAEKNIEHRIDLERTALFGERNVDTSSTANPRRYAGGLFYFLTGATNTTDMGGIMTDPEVESFLQNVFAHTGSGNNRLFLASPLLITVIDQIAMGRLQVVQGADVYGLSIKQWVTGHGTLNIVKERLLENGAGGTGYAGFGLALDLDKIKFRFLRDRNTKLRMDIQAPDLDGIKDEYLTEAGWEIANPLVHGIVKGVTG
jgi:hypothetical protein